MRGERATTWNGKHAVGGSSPHARGTHGQILRADAQIRFIPACAGNADSEALMKRIEPVHPRMRGERKRRMRILRRAVRFIPACAGNAFPQERLVISNTVHPRMRGERTVAVALWFDLSGSSPHARGTLRILIRRKPEKRFIPACAGNACPLFSIGHENPVHPRMRGERVISLRYDGFKGGSSPHARGTPFCTDIQVSPRRFIPACAGNAGRLRRCSRWMTVHPRMRGERLPPQ